MRWQLIRNLITKETPENILWEGQRPEESKKKNQYDKLVKEKGYDGNSKYWKSLKKK